uniref:HMG box domain-containing protein n=1 Tax=Mycena chlorophos TaxID=658473 RepID=A0ABQ0LX35_MYCCL|nr:predicted protein [Mycena chlorophos]
MISHDVPSNSIVDSLSHCPPTNMPADRTRTRTRAPTQRGITAKPTDPSQAHIPRPANAFIIYRAERSKAQRVPGSKQGDASQSIATQWKAEPREVRAVYEAKAAEAKRVHEEMYPGYKYQPRRPGEKKVPRVRQPRRRVVAVDEPTSSADATDPGADTKTNFPIIPAAGGSAESVATTNNFWAGGDPPSDYNTNAGFDVSLLDAGHTYTLPPFVPPTPEELLAAPNTEFGLDVSSTNPLDDADFSYVASPEQAGLFDASMFGDEPFGRLENSGLDFLNHDWFSYADLGF